MALCIKQDVNVVTPSYQGHYGTVSQNKAIKAKVTSNHQQEAIWSNWCANPITYKVSEGHTK